MRGKTRSGPRAARGNWGVHGKPNEEKTLQKEGGHQRGRVAVEGDEHTARRWAKTRGLLKHTTQVTPTFAQEKEGGGSGNCKDQMSWLDDGKGEKIMGKSRKKKGRTGDAKKNREEGDKT